MILFRLARTSGRPTWQRFAARSGSAMVWASSMTVTSRQSAIGSKTIAQLAGLLSASRRQLLAGRRTGPWVKGHAVFCQEEQGRQNCAPSIGVTPHGQSVTLGTSVISESGPGVLGVELLQGCG